MPVAIEPPWEELHGNLRAFIGRRVRNQADVDDLVQRVLLQVVKGLGSLRDRERLHAWVYRTARNVVVDYYRSPALRREVPSGDAGDVASAQLWDGPAPAGDDETEESSLRELGSCLLPMLRHLSPAYSDAVTLVDLEGVSQVDAAKRLGVSVSGMKSRVQRGRRQLRTILDQCCRIDLDRRGGVVGFERRRAPDGDGSCDGCD